MSLLAGGLCLSLDDAEDFPDEPRVECRQKSYSPQSSNDDQASDKNQLGISYVPDFLISVDAHFTHLRV